MFNLEDDAPARRLAYLTATALILVTVIQSVAGLWPLQFGSIQWRYQAANSLSTVLMFPFLGLAMTVLIARAADSTGMSKTLGILSAVCTMVLAASLVVFVLDALQLKAIIPSRNMQGFQVASVRIGIVTTLFTVLFAILTITALKPPRGFAARTVKARKKSDATADDNVGLLIGQEFAKAE